MKVKLFILCLVLILNVMLSGCASAPSPRAVAAARTKPFIVALEAYHRDTGDYPAQLDDLRPRYLAVDVPWYDQKDLAHVWEIAYVRVNRDSYKLDFDSSPCSQAVFENGRLTWAGGPNYK